jgi:WD40 repeat protein
MFDLTVHRYDAVTGQEVCPPPGPHGAVTRVSFSTDGRELFTASFREIIRKWSVVTGTPEPLPRIEAGSALTFSNDLRLVLGVKSRALHCYELGTGKQRWQITAHPRDMSSVTVSPDGRYVATSGMDDMQGRVSVALWSAESGKLIWRTPNFDSTVFTPDGRHLWCRTAEANALCILDTKDGKELARFPLSIEQHLSGPVSGDGKTLAVLNVPSWRTVTLIETATGKTRLQFDAGDLILASALSPDGRLFVTGHNNGELRFFDTRDGRLLRTCPAHNGSVQAIAFDSTGERLATGSTDCTALVWDVHELLEK